MQIDLDTLVSRANISLQDEPGFLHCSVESSSGRLLAYEFSDTQCAHAFQGNRELLGVVATIPDNRQTTVIVKRI